MPAAAPSASPGTSSFDFRTMVRARTQAIHDRIEELPLSRAIIEETVERAGYALLLSQLEYVHSEVEAQAPAFPELSAFSLAVERSELARADLEALGCAMQPVLPSARSFLKLAAEAAEKGTASFLGVLYVIAGSRMGGLVVQRHLARAFGLSLTAGVGLDYHVAGAKTFPREWQVLCKSLPEHLGGRADGIAFGRAAVATMQGFYEIYREVGATA